MKRKVFGIEVPPISQGNELSCLPQELWSKVSPKLCGFSSKGDYLSWDEFITRTPELKGYKEAAWYLLKLKRNLEAIDTLFAYKPNRSATLTFYSISSLVHKIHKIERLSTLKHLKLQGNDSQRYLTTSLIMEESISSAQMEGAATTRPVAKELLSTGREPRNFSERMIINNYQLMKFAKASILDPLTMELIQKFNMVATQEVSENDHIAGMIREGDIAVRSVTDDEIIHQAPDADKIRPLLTNLCLFANGEHEGAEFIHPIVKAIILHFMIGYIHPFADGNGRTARALFYWFMLKSGYDNFEFISISSLLKSSKNRYARAFVKSEVDEFDLTHFIDFNMGIIIRALESFTTFMQKKIEEIERTRLDLYKSPYFREFKHAHITIIKKALEDAGREFTVKEWQTEFNVTAAASRGYLDKLVDLNLLIKSKEKGSRQHKYLAPRNLKERLKID
ncbi:Fic family protein [Shewanella frigidimarina]|uniref:Fic family protein n=1 Tax=Shewanella frigidimarina TaxID=56812 RepID=UPI003F9EE061